MDGRIELFQRDAFTPGLGGELARDWDGERVVVGDRDFTGKGMITELFGKPVRFPEGPAAFALKTKASILPCFMVRNPDDSFTLKIEKPIELVSGGNKEEDIKKCMREYAKIFESYIRKYPEQWYVFRNFWAENK